MKTHRKREQGSAPEPVETNRRRNRQRPEVAEQGNVDPIDSPMPDRGVARNVMCFSCGQEMPWDVFQPHLQACRPAPERPAPAEAPPPPPPRSFVERWPQWVNPQTPNSPNLRRVPNPFSRREILFDSPESVHLPLLPQIPPIPPIGPISPMRRMPNENPFGREDDNFFLEIEGALTMLNYDAARLPRVDPNDSLGFLRYLPPDFDIQPNFSRPKTLRSKIRKLPTQVFRVKSEKAGQGSDCVICFQAFNEREKLRRLPCNHLFHPTCIDTWLGFKPICPLCRRRAFNR